MWGAVTLLRVAREWRRSSLTVLARHLDRWWEDNTLIPALRESLGHKGGRSGWSGAPVREPGARVRVGRGLRNDQFSASED